jgi:preprotein translocase subunit SecD
MKTIRIIIIAILIGSTVMPFMPTRMEAQTSFTIQVTGQHLQAGLLEASATIISNRIQDFTGKKPTCELLSAEGKIRIVVKGEWSPELLGELALRKGEMNIYELSDPSTVLSFISAESTLAQQIRDASETSQGKPELLSVNRDKLNETSLALQAITTEIPVLWAWGTPGADGVSLYALKLEKGHSPVFESSPVKTARAIHDKKSGNNRIEILFNEPASGLWADATERNINKYLAMVVDKVAVCVPMVRATITGGRSAITGNFTLEELKFMEALLGNGVLPLEFTLVK